MENERAASITIGGKEYELVLTTGATKQIAKRYGGLASLGDKLMKAENFEMALGEIIWLITLLANQPLLIHNLKNKNDTSKMLAYTIRSGENAFTSASYTKAGESTALAIHIAKDDWAKAYAGDYADTVEFTISYK